jgi:hypothetical protein
MVKVSDLHKPINNGDEIMFKKRGSPKLNPETMHKMIQKLIQEKRLSVNALARQIHTQPRIVESVLAGKGEFKTKRTQMSLVKLYLLSIAR